MYLNKNDKWQLSLKLRLIEKALNEILANKPKDPNAIIASSVLCEVGEILEMEEN